MSLFSFLTREVAMDLGTANSIIIFNDKIVVDEPSVVAIDKRTNKLAAVGKDAKLMQGKTNPYYETIRPLKGGVIADYETANLMIRELIKKINVRRTIIPPSLRMVICIPSGITNVEERAVREAAEQAGAKDVRLIHEPMAAAIGAGIDVLEPLGNMIVDIGGGTAEIAVISLGGIACSKSVRIAGDEFNDNIVEYMRKQHNMNIGERKAEETKIAVGAAIPDLDSPPEDFAVQGTDIMTGLPKEININYKEIAHALDKSIAKIEEAVAEVLSITSPELASDIYHTGIYLAGGGALLRGLDKRISNRVKLSVHVAEDPLRAVARGTGIALKNYEKFTFLIR
ncbi:MAG: rod shape-determining protein [Bacteroidales bacterium]|jgi:rod shape-determining protein MreB|nr:rod shape-determining protein [Bacteroidales bacterium]